MNDSKQTCRWGILSAANIARKNWLAIKNSGNGIVAAVASRSVSKAQSFIDQCQSNEPFELAPLAIEGYEALLQSPTIDAVYIPLPTGLRKDWVIRAAEAGKHILCEKPCAPNASELREMINACKSNNVQFMDGVMYMHGRRLNEMRKTLDDGTSVGAIRRISSQFSFHGGDDFVSNNIRGDYSLEPLGALGDLGWYTIRFSLWAMKYQMPEYVTATLLTEHRPDSKHPSVPLEISAELFFAGGVSAAFYNSFITEHQQWANISGNRGYLHCPDFVLPYHNSSSKFFITKSVHQNDGCRFKMFEHKQEVVVDESSDSEPDSPETNLFRNFAELVNSKRVDSQWPEITLKTQLVLDAVLESARHGGKRVSLG